MTNEECYEALRGVCEKALGRPLTLEERGNAALAAENLVRTDTVWRLKGFQEKAVSQPGVLFRHLLRQIREDWEAHAGAEASETRKRLVGMLYDCIMSKGEDPETFVLIRIVREYPGFFLKTLYEEEGETL